MGWEKKNPMTWEKKVWGEVRHLFASDRAAVSFLRLKQGFQCSQHYHLQRANQFLVLSGSVKIEEWATKFDRTGTKTTLKAGQVYTVPSLVAHRFHVIEDGEIIELYWPDRGGSVQLDDIVRLDQGGPIGD